jgi:hypothetical protein
MAMTNTIVYSGVQGLVLSLLVFILGWNTNTYNLNFTKFVWLILPIISYLISLGLLAIVNSSACGSVNLPLIATSSIFTFVAVIFFLIISYFGFFQNFIIPILPPSLQASFGTIIATSFFVFWGGMYGGAFGYGFAQSCPS